VLIASPTDYLNRLPILYLGSGGNKMHSSSLPIRLPTFIGSTNSPSHYLHLLGQQIRLPIFLFCLFPPRTLRTARLHHCRASYLPAPSPPPSPEISRRTLAARCLAPVVRPPPAAGAAISGATSSRPSAAGSPRPSPARPDVVFPGAAAPHGTMQPSPGAVQLHLRRGAAFPR
jgi:hypothetical protein